MIAAALLRRPRTLLLVLLVIIAAGGAALAVLPRLEDPTLTKRIALVQTVWPGADARAMETSVARPIERAVATLPAIAHVRSISRDGLTTHVLELGDEITDAATVWQRVRERLSEVRDDLPASSRPPDLFVFPLRAYTSIIAIVPTEDGSLLDVAEAADELRERLLRLDGSERVDLFGRPQERFAVEAAPTDLIAAGLNVPQIAAAIEASLVDRPGGELAAGADRVALTVQQPASAIKRIETVSVRGPRGPVRVADIANVRREVIAGVPDVAIVDGREAVVLAALFDDNGRVDGWADAVEAQRLQFEAEYAGSLVTQPLLSQARHVEQRMQSLLLNLAMSVAAVSLVVLLLMGWRSMLVVASSLPLSALLVLAAMRVLGIPVHQMSVTGLIVALGLLIDATIVVVDEMANRLSRGESPVDALSRTVGLMTVPLLGSTITTALAFLPIATLPGPPGEFVGTIATSVILAITASLVVSLTIVPAVLGLLEGSRTEASPGVRRPRSLLRDGLHLPRLSGAYAAVLRWLFAHPFAAVLLSVAAPVAGFALLPTLPEQFFPASDRAEIQIEIERPAGSTVAQTRETVQRASDLIDGDDAVTRQAWFLGRSVPTFFYNVVPRRAQAPNYAQAMIAIDPAADPAVVVRDLQTRLDAVIGEARVIVRQLAQGPPYDAPVEVRVLGPDVDVLADLGDTIRRTLAADPAVVQTRSDLSDRAAAITLQPNADAPVAASQLSGLLYAGTVGADAGTADSLPVVVRLRLDEDEPLDDVLALPLSVLTSVPPPSPTIGQFASPTLTAAPGGILRIDGQRAAEVKAYISAGVLPAVVTEGLAERLAADGLILPPGYRLELGGEREQRSRAIDRLIANSVTLLALMLLTVVATFGSFRCGLLIAAVGGLTAGLGPLALATFGYPFGFMAVVGTMGLVGVAINDSIIVLTQIRQAEATAAIFVKSSGRLDLDALVAVIVAATRHVLSTTLTTVVGFLPLVLAGGRFWPPLAVTIAGGVAGGTLIALLFTPAVYLLIRRRSRRD